MQAEVGRNRGGTRALVGLPDHLGTFHNARFGRTRMGQTLNHGLFFRTQFT